MHPIRFLKEECLKNDTLAKIMRDDSASREILQVSLTGSGSLCLRLPACHPLMTNVEALPPCLLLGSFHIVQCMSH